MEIFIKKSGCKCNSTVRQIQEFSMCNSFGAIVIFVLSLIKAFPIAIRKYQKIEFIKESLYADKFMWFFALLFISFFIAFLFNSAVYNCNIKKMSLYCAINGIVSVVAFMAFTIYTTTKNYDLQFAGYLTMILPLVAFAFELYEILLQNKFEKSAEVNESEAL